MIGVEFFTIEVNEGIEVVDDSNRRYGVFDDYETAIEKIEELREFARRN